MYIYGFFNHLFTFATVPCEILCVTPDKVPASAIAKNIKQIGLLISRVVETCLNFLSWSYFSSLP